MCVAVALWLAGAALLQAAASAADAAGAGTDPAGNRWGNTTAGVDFLVAGETVEFWHPPRLRRESHPLIGTFDISKMFKKKKYTVQPASGPRPSASPLRVGSPLPLNSPPVSTTLFNTPTASTTPATTSSILTTTEPKENIFTVQPTKVPKVANLKKPKTSRTMRTTSTLSPIVPANQTVAKTKPSNKKKSRKTKAATKAPLPNVSARNESSVDRGARVAASSARDAVTWPVKHAAVVEGDIILGGLMMVHARSEGATCGRVMAQGGVQALEAMLFALDRTHALALAPPGVRLGAHVLDDCDNDTYGLEMALDFIKGSISNIDDAEFACNASAVRKVISGVVGAASSVTSVQVANLLRLFKIPQVSFFSTSPELSNKARFEYFTRTIPSDLHQVRAMVEIVKKLGWSYVSIIYEESNYGIKAFEELETMLARNDICIAVKERLVKDSGEADEQAYDALVLRLLSRPRARGVIVFGSDQEVAGVMAAVTRLNVTDTFGWVGSDGWSARALVSDGNEHAVEGTISVQPQANPVRGFKEYFLNLTVENNKRNPWFVEFWEEQFRCRYPGSARTPYNAEWSRACTGREQLANSNVEFEAQLQFVADAVLAFAHAIRDMHRELCGGAPGLCEAMRPASGATLLRYLRRVRFVGLSGDEFHFDSNGDGPARYNILHFKQFKRQSPAPPLSVCSAPCELGQAKQYVEGESCCWHCFNCTQYEIRSPFVETACEECPLGTLPDPTRTRCAPLPALHMRPSAPPAIAACTFSACGIACTLFVVVVWFVRGDTPVVRASGRELSFVLLGGILTCYLLTFALVLKPTDLLCGLQRFGTGCCFTVVYAALLTKTNRIARIFDASRRSARRPSLISPKSQLVICSILVSIQVVVLSVWQVVSPARAVRHFPAREQQLLVCDSHVGASIAIAFSYPGALVLVCTVYAVLTRKIPEAFNESKHIGFTMYTTCVIWLAFVPLYFGTASHVTLRVTSMAITISLSASVTLICLFTPKLYIILLRPERNVRGSLMPSKWRGACGAASAAAGGAVSAALLGSAAAAPLRPPDPTPSTDRSTLPDTDRVSDRQVQTDDLPLYPRLEKLFDGVIDGIRLDARRLAEVNAGLPPFNTGNGAAVAEMAQRSSADRLERENADLRSKLDALNGKVHTLSKELAELRKSRGQPEQVVVNASSRSSDEVLLAQIRTMIDGKIAYLESKLLPQEVLRPPLRHETANSVSKNLREGNGTKTKKSEKKAPPAPDKPLEQVQQNAQQTDQNSEPAWKTVENKKKKKGNTPKAPENRQVEEITKNTRKKNKGKKNKVKKRPEGTRNCLAPWLLPFLSRKGLN
ncbi:receptor family ligand binding region domain-containing protein [Phthorimaea operculella]|nr:receptor family ligand binding region domain-containing protein [Phthorimaea operculella]